MAFLHLPRFVAEADKFITCRCQVSSGYCISKIIKLSVDLLRSYSKINKWEGRFLRHSVVSHGSCSWFRPRLGCLRSRSLRHTASPAEWIGTRRQWRLHCSCTGPTRNRRLCLDDISRIRLCNTPYSRLAAFSVANIQEHFTLLLQTSPIFLSPRPIIIFYTGAAVAVSVEIGLPLRDLSFIILRRCWFRRILPRGTCPLTGWLVAV